MHGGWGFTSITFPGNASWILGTNLDVESSYLIVVLSIEEITSTTANAQIIFTAKPDGSNAYNELKAGGLSTINNTIASTFTIGAGIGGQSGPFYFYEFGVINRYVNDTEFDEIVDSLKAKYYGDGVVAAPKTFELTAEAVNNNTVGDTSVTFQTAAKWLDGNVTDILTFAVDTTDVANVQTTLVTTFLEDVFVVYGAYSDGYPDNAFEYYDSGALPNSTGQHIQAFTTTATEVVTLGGTAPTEVEVESDIGDFPPAWTESGWTTINATTIFPASEQSLWSGYHSTNRNMHTKTIDGIEYKIFTTSEIAGYYVRNIFQNYSAFGIDNRDGYDQHSSLGSNGYHSDNTGGVYGNPIPIYINLSTQINLKAYYISTRKLNTNYDPNEWSVYVSNDGEEWIEIDSQTNQHQDPIRLSQSGDNGGAGGVRRIDVPSYTGFYSWIKFVFVPSSGVTGHLSQNDWRFESTTATVGTVDVPTSHAVSKVVSPDTRTYTSVIMAKRLGEYHATLNTGAAPIQKGDLELDIAGYSAGGSVPNLGVNQVNSTVPFIGTAAAPASVSVDTNELSYIQLNAGKAIDMGSELHILTDAPPAFTLFYSFKPKTANANEFMFMIASGINLELFYSTTNQLRLRVVADNEYQTINGTDLHKLIISYSTSSNTYSVRWYNATTSTFLANKEVSGSASNAFNATHMLLNGNASGAASPGQDLYAFKLYAQHLDDLTASGVYDNFISGAAPAAESFSLGPWTPTLTDLTRVVVNDFAAAAETNAITVQSGYALTVSEAAGVQFDKVWLFAVQGSGVAVAAPAGMVTTNALVLYDAYRADAVSGTTLTDYSGNDRHATITGGLSIADDGFVFTGSNTVVLNNVGNPSGNWVHSFSIWVNINNFPTTTPQVICSIGTASTDKLTGFYIVEGRDGDMRYYFYTNDVEYDVSDVLSVNTWYHMAFVYDGTIRTLYINGTAYTGTTTGSGTLNINANTTLGIGYENARSNYYFSGKIRQFAVYDGVLTAEQIEQNYNAGLSAPTTASAASASAGFTEAQLQTMTSIFIENAGNVGVTHQEFANVSFQNFGGLTLTQAFANIDGPASVTIDAANVAEYTTVGVGLKDGEYYAGLASLTAGAGPADTTLVNTPTVVLYDLYSTQDPTMLFDNIKSSATLGTDSLLFDNGLYSTNNNDGSKGYVYLEFDTVVRLSKLRIWQVTGASSGRAVGSVWVTMTETEQTSADVDTMFSIATLLMDSINQPNTGYTTTTEDGVDVVEILVDSAADLTGSYMYIRFGSQDATKGLTEIAELEIYSYVDTASTTITTSTLQWTEIPAANLGSADRVVVTDFSAATNEITVQSGYALASAGADFDKVWLFAVEGAGIVVTTESVNYTALSTTPRSSPTSVNSTATAIDDYGITLGWSTTTWGAFHPDITLTPTIGNYYDFEAYVERNDTSVTDMVIALYTETSYNYASSTFSSATGGDVNVGWFFKFKSSSPEVQMGYKNPTPPYHTSLNIAWDDFPIYHRIKFVDKSEVTATASLSVAYSVIYELYSDPERTQLEFELPIDSQYVVNGYDFAPTTFDPIPLSIFTYGIANNKIHFKNFYGKDDIVPASAAGFTEAQLQTMTSIFIENAGNVGVTHQEFTNVSSFQDFGGLTLTQAFANIDGPASVTIDAANVAEYTTVGVGLKGNEYYAGLASLTAGQYSDPALMELVSDLNVGTVADAYTNGIYGTYTRRIVLHNGDVVHTTKDKDVAAAQTTGTSGTVHGGNAFIPYDDASPSGTYFYAAVTEGVSGEYIALLYTFDSGPKTLAGVKIQNGSDHNPSATSYIFVATEVEFYYLPQDNSEIISASDLTNLVQITKSPAGQTGGDAVYTEYNFDSNITTKQIEIRIYNSSGSTYTNHKQIGSIDFFETPTSAPTITTSTLQWTAIDAANLGSADRVVVTDFSAATNAITVDGATPPNYYDVYDSNWGTESLDVDGASKSFFKLDLGDGEYYVHANKYYTSGFEPYKVFGQYRTVDYGDASGGTYDTVGNWGWLNGFPPSTNSDTILYIKVPNAIHVSSYFFGNNNQSSRSTDDPNSWYLYASNDGTQWTQLDRHENTYNSRSDSGEPEYREFEPPSYTGFHVWFKFVFDNQTANTGRLSITDFRFKSSIVSELVSSITVQSGYALSSAGVDFDKVWLFAVEGAGVAAAASANSERNIEITVGGQTMTATINDEIDANADKTPWILVLNYLHKGGTTPATVVKTTGSGLPYLPEDNTKQLFSGNGVTSGEFNAGLLGEDDQLDPYSWGHAGNDLFNKLCIALGSDSGNQNGLELKWTAYGGTRGTHAIHFRSDGGLVHFRTGFGTSGLEIKESYTPLWGDEDMLPRLAMGGYSDEGDYAFNDFPFYWNGGGSNDYHWGAGGRLYDHGDTGSTSWAINQESYAVYGTYNTYHQIWVRADVATLPAEMSAALYPPPSAPGFTEAQLQTAVDVFLPAYGEANVSYYEYADVSFQDFGGVALAKAMATIDSQTVRAIDSATVSEYTTVGIGKKGDQFYAGMASKGAAGSSAGSSAPVVTESATGLQFSHPDNGKTWKLSGNNIKLNSGTEFTVDIFNDASVYNNADGAVALFKDGDFNYAVRHTGYIMFLNAFQSDNFDFVWKLITEDGGQTYKIFNYYTLNSNDYYVNYDAANDVVKIMPADATNGIISWKCNVKIDSNYVYPNKDSTTNVYEPIVLPTPTLTTSTLQWTDQFPMYLHMDASRATTVSAGSTTLAAGGVVDQVSGTAFSYYGTTPVLHANGGIHMNGGHLYLDFGTYSTNIGDPATTGMNTTVMCVAQQLGDSTMQTMFSWNTNQAVLYNIMRMGDSGSATYQEMTVSDFNRSSGNDGNRKYDSSGDLETRIYVGTVEHNVNATDASLFDQTVTLRVYDDTGQNVFEGLPDSRTIAYTSISYVFTNSRYVQLGGYAGSNHSTNLTVMELKWFQNKLSPEEEAAQVSAMAAKWGPPPYSEEWVLVARDYKGTADFAQYQNSAGDFGDDSVLATAYSRFYSLYSSDTGAGDFNDTEIKSRGYYEFKWIPYFTSPVTNANRVDPETDTLYDNPGTTVERYIQWTQTGNPLKTNTGSSGVIPGFSLIDQQNADVTVGTSENQFNGLALSDHPTSAILDGNGEVNNWYYACGTVSTWAIPWDKTGVNDTITSSELYVRKITETAAAAPIERALVSQADASNSSLTVSETGITNIFDYDSTQIGTISFSKELNRFVLNNGDSFYCPTDDLTLVAGKLFDNDLSTQIQFRPNDRSPSGLNVYRFYYEPQSDIYVNQLTIYAGANSNGESLHDLFVVNGATSTSVTGLSLTLPKTLPAGSSRTVTFDPVVIGPGKPLRIRISEINARTYLTEFILEYTL
jgi:hypothetical protein